MEDIKELKFEEALEKLETIVDELEEGSVDLEESLELFENGVKLARMCREKLTKAEEKVKILMEEEGELEVEEFEPDEK